MRGLGLATDVDDGLRQRVVGFNRFGIRLEVTLGSNQFNQLGSQVNVGTPRAPARTVPKPAEPASPYFASPDFEVA